MIKRLITVTLFTLIYGAFVLADEEAIRLELERSLKTDLARSSAPIKAAAKAVDLLSNLSLAIETSEKLDKMERKVAQGLTKDECALIKMPIYSTSGDGQSIPGEPIYYGRSTKPVNLLVEKEVEESLVPSIGAGPPKDYYFDKAKSFFLCYSVDEKDVKRRGLLPYSTAIGLINDKGQELIKKAARDVINRTRPSWAKSWRCNYKSYDHLSPNGCADPEQGGTWTSAEAKGP
jgi:hypothetical protein